MFLQPAFLGHSICARIRDAMDRGVADAAEIVGDEIERRETVRRARSIEIDSDLVDLVDARLDAARARIEHRLGVALGSREGTGFLRYHAGGFYRPHRDRGRVAGWTGALRRHVTVVIFLNSGSDSDPQGFAGGELCLYPEAGDPVRICPQTGMLAAFPADLLHEVRPIVSGTRDTAIDWFYGR